MGGGNRGGGGGGGGGAATGGGTGAATPSAARPRASTPTTAPPRGASTKSILKLDWDFPTYNAGPAVRSSDTAAKELRHALAREEALKIIAGDDPRPLLVLRECQFCNKTDDALLQPGADNERTILMARWFHCVKLPQDVIQPDHPFNALFPTNDAEHLFVSARDGSAKMPLESDTSRAELWSSMADVLTASYTTDATAAVKEVRRALDKLDVLDQKVLDLEKKRAELMETPRVEDSKVKKLDDEIDAAKKEVSAQKAAIAKVATLELKPAGSRDGGAAKAGR